MRPLFSGATPANAAYHCCRRVAMTRLAQLLLVLTSLAPIGFVQAAVLFGRGRHSDTLSLGAAALLMAIVCHLLLYGFRQRCSDIPKVTSDLSTKESEPLAFLVAYALPLVSAKADEASVWRSVYFATSKMKVNRAGGIESPR